MNPDMKRYIRYNQEGEPLTLTESGERLRMSILDDDTAPEVLKKIDATIELLEDTDPVAILNLFQSGIAICPKDRNALKAKMQYFRLVVTLGMDEDAGV